VKSNTKIEISFLNEKRTFCYCSHLIRRILLQQGGSDIQGKKAQENVTNPLESESSSTPRIENPLSSEWLKLGVIAAASALAGGVAAAWWYRNTLKKLRQADERLANPEYGISGDDPADES
jgi:hypothetical protein